MAASIAGSYYFSRTFPPRRRGRVLPERGLRGAAEVHAAAPAREAVGLDEGIQGDFEAECRRAGDGGLPGLHDARGIGLLFGVKTEELTKTELVIFLRPRIIDNASLDTNLSDFKRFLNPKLFSQ